VRAADSGAEIAMTWKTVVPPLPSLLAAVRPRWVNYRFALATDEVVARGHRDGVLVSAWTVDTGRTMRRLLRSGVDALTTNRVDVLVRLLQTGAAGTVQEEQP
jgi:glycerophosphoryl diester phosphodiesterase